MDTHLLTIVVSFSPMLLSLQETATLPSAGPYAITITAYDRAGNYRTARRLIIFDDSSIVSLQGESSYKTDSNGDCTWNKTPSPPIVTNADPNASCNWITKNVSSVNIAWTER